jgi:outer membrane protein assembly factor BamD
MIKYSYLFLLTLIFFSNSCTKSDKKENIIVEKDLVFQFTEAYTEGVKALEGGDVLFAAKKFNEAETLYPQYIMAPNAALMAAYSYYVQDYYQDAIAELIRFKKVYPYHKHLDYVEYLIAISYYEQIVDEKKDLNSIIKSKKYFESILNKYPDTEYAKDAEFKIDLINEILAAKEMYIARYYFDKKKWIPSINRLKTIVNKYETTVYVEEALHRLVEVHYIIGLEDEAKKYAKLLGYNYQSSKWYQQSYSIFDKRYKKVDKFKKKKISRLKKIKSLFD